MLTRNRVKIWTIFEPTNGPNRSPKKAQRTCRFFAKNLQVLCKEPAGSLHETCRLWRDFERQRTCKFFANNLQVLCQRFGSKKGPKMDPFFGPKKGPFLDPSWTQKGSNLLPNKIVFNASYPEGTFGRNQLLASLYPCVTNDLHVCIATSLHQSFL